MPGLHVSNVLIFQGNNYLGFQRQVFYQKLCATFSSFKMNWGKLSRGNNSTRLSQPKFCLYSAHGHLTAELRVPQHQTPAASLPECSAKYIIKSLFSPHWVRYRHKAKSPHYSYGEAMKAWVARQSCFQSDAKEQFNITTRFHSVLLAQLHSFQTPWDVAYELIFNRRTNAPSQEQH